jgi:FG-GAP-like repeat
MTKHGLVFMAALLAWFAGTMPTSQLAAQPPAFLKTQLDSKFRSEGAAIGDFNHDGAPDIAAGNVWYQAPTWQMHAMRGTALEYDPLGYSDSFANFVDDLNDDGWDDLIVVGFPGAPTIWYENPNNTGGPWTARQAVPVTNNESPAYVDVDGDGHRELVFGHSPDGNPNSTQRRLAFAQPGSNPTQLWSVRTFSAAAAPGSGQFSHGLGVGDMNLDGRKDVLTQLGWYEAPTDPSQPVWTFHALSLGPDSGQMHVYDFDGDGDQDVLSSSAHNYGIWWHERRPTGPVTHEIFDGFSQSHSLEMADLDSNGLPDFVTGKRRFAHPPPGDPGTFEPSVLYWFELTRSGATPLWTPHEIDSTSGVGTQFEIGDVNGDGRLDIVTANKNGVFLFEQMPSGPGLLPGDYNRSGGVDAADYVVWRNTIGQVGTGLAADGNLNNQIDTGDYDIWRANFGRAPSEGSSAASGAGTRANTPVPEPTAVIMLIVAMAVLSIISVRKCRADVGTSPRLSSNAAAGRTAAS